MGRRALLILFNAYHRRAIRRRVHQRRAGGGTSLVVWLALPDAEPPRCANRNFLSAGFHRDGLTPTVASGSKTMSGI